MDAEDASDDTIFFFSFGFLLVCLTLSSSSPWSSSSYLIVPRVFRANYFSHTARMRDRYRGHMMDSKHKKMRQFLESIFFVCQRSALTKFPSFIENDFVGVFFCQLIFVFFGYLFGGESVFCLRPAPSSASSSPIPLNNTMRCTRLRFFVGGGVHVAASPYIFLHFFSYSVMNCLYLRLYYRWAFVRASFMCRIELLLSCD